MGAHEIEPDSIETLDLEIDYHHPWNSKEYLRVAVVPEESDTCSLVIVHFSKDHSCVATQACLTKDEIDLVIKGLNEAKERMITI